MRIAISGTHGVGKTTLAKKISEEFKIHLVKEKAHELLTTKYSFPEIQNDINQFFQFQLDILDLQQAEEDELLSAGKDFVVDRPFIDSFVYVKARFQSQHSFNMNYFLNYRARVQNLMFRRYDHIFFIRKVSDPVEDNSIRNLDPKYAYLIDHLLDEEYKNNESDWNIDMIPIAGKSTLEERLQIVKICLNKQE